ncbi:MAG: glycosyltransferase family 4 protein [Ginsengibacter sp.]
MLQLVTERQYRGAQVFAAELSNMLATNGHEVLFVGLYATKENILVAQGAENIDLKGKKIAFDLSLLRRLMKLIKKTKPDIIQANGSDTLKYAALAKIFNPGLNIVYRNISMVSSWTKQGSLKRKFSRFLFKKVNRVTSVGQQSMDDLVKTYGYPLAKTKLIRRGIPQFNYETIAARKKIIAEFNFPQTDFILAHTGQFSPEKNHEFMIESFEKVLAHDHRGRLLFIGEGKKFREIKELVVKKNLDKHILFTGYRENVQELLAGCDIFILGSTIEGVPGVVLEAGIQSLPTVAVNVGGVGEVVINGKTGILLDKHDADAFSKAIVSLLENEKLRQSLGVNAKRFVQENYSLQNSLKAFEHLYADIVKEKSS